MKRLSSILVLLALVMIAPASEVKDTDNDFYNNTPYTELGTPELTVDGEVLSAGKMALGELPLRTIIYRETRLVDGKKEFGGAFRYEGYALSDILNTVQLQKKNQAEFNLPLDLLLAVENAAGEKVVLSWGELFYPSVQHRILIAVRAAPIVPTKTGKIWQVPSAPRLICGADLASARNLSAPRRLTVISVPHSFPVTRNIDPLYAGVIQLTGADGRGIGKIRSLPGRAEERTYPECFYGRGMGFHGYEEFQGRLLRDVLAGTFAPTPDTLKKGYFVIVGADGYRIAVSASELYNRNDRNELLLIDRGVGENGGRFSLFPAVDFFSDRAVKAVQEIRYDTIR